jgi:HAD superfamily hydrolase (TIGR01493 family)
MARAQAFVFDAYDTLFEVHSVMVTLKDVTADAEAVSLQWRVKQLEYAWRHSLSGNSNSIECDQNLWEAVEIGAWQELCVESHCTLGDHPAVPTAN